MIPENALSYNGHHYYIYNDVKSNWETAASNCRDRGGYMAVINDEERISIRISVSGIDE